MPIKDMPIYWDMGAYGAGVTHFFSPDTAVIPKPQWDAMRLGYACIGDSDFAYIRELIELLCADNKMVCTPDVKIRMKKFFSNMDNRPRRR